MIAPWIWYCFDDWLAEVSGNPHLGEVPWPVVLMASLFWIGLRYRNIREIRQSMK